MKKKSLFIGMLIAGVMIVAYTLITRFEASSQTSDAPVVGTAISDIPLASSERGEVKLRDFQGQWVLLFFGYKSCPDVCPTTLSYLANEYKHLTTNQPPQVIFISVDPRRDDPQDLTKFVKYFSPDFIGVTGKEENLRALAQGLGAFFDYATTGAEKPDKNNYTVQHSGSLFLLDPQGKLFKTISPPHTLGVVAHEVSNLPTRF